MFPMSLFLASYESLSCLLCVCPLFILRSHYLIPSTLEELQCYANYEVKTMGLNTRIV